MGRLGPCPTTGHPLTSEARALALLGDGVQVDRSTPASGPHCPPALRAPRSPAELPECRQHRSWHPSATPSSLPSPQGAEGTVGSGEQSRVGMVQLRARWTSLELGGGVWAGDGSRKQPQGTAKENTLPGSCGTSKLRAEAAEGTVRSGRAGRARATGHAETPTRRGGARACRAGAVEDILWPAPGRCPRPQGPWRRARGGRGALGQETPARGQAGAQG